MIKTAKLEPVLTFLLMFVILNVTEVYKDKGNGHTIWTIPTFNRATKRLFKS